MSLISGANFVAPLRSKVQIVGIFALAVLVAVLRLAGSAHNSDDSPRASERRGFTQTAATGAMAADDVDSYLASRRRSKSRVDAPASGDVTVERLLQGEDSESVDRGAQDDTTRDAPQPEKLNDIKRSLGLE